MAVWILDNPVQPYAWGSRTAIAELAGRPSPTAEPEAELWMGAHRRGPSRVAEQGASLADLIARDPDTTLGPQVVARFGPRLPFLFKVLAAAQPLSLQAHPNATQARAGFEREQTAGIPADAPHRNYRDDQPKPELLCALGPFVALCGFASLESIRQRAQALSVPRLGEVLAPLWSDPREGLRVVMGALLTMDAPAPLVDAVLGACARPSAAAEPWASHLRWVQRLGERYPGDVGVVVSLLLNLVRLRAGEALYLGAGQLHCYLEGTGVEIMASSDNVLRGGLTTKHVDPPELLRVLDVRPTPVEIRRPQPCGGGEARYATPTEAFALSRVELSPGGRWEAEVTGPEILLCTTGSISIDAGGSSITLGPGRSAFVCAAQRSYAVRATMAAVVQRATVGR